MYTYKQFTTDDIAILSYLGRWHIVVMARMAVSGHIISCYLSMSDRKQEMTHSHGNNTAHNTSKAFYILRQLPWELESYDNHLGDYICRGAAISVCSWPRQQNLLQFVGESARRHHVLCRPMATVDPPRVNDNSREQVECFWQPQSAPGSVLSTQWCCTLAPFRGHSHSHDRTTPTKTQAAFMDTESSTRSHNLTWPPTGVSQWNCDWRVYTYIRHYRSSPSSIWAHNRARSHDLQSAPPGVSQWYCESPWCLSVVPSPIVLVAAEVLGVVLALLQVFLQSERHRQRHDVVASHTLQYREPTRVLQI